MDRVTKSKPKEVCKECGQPPIHVGALPALDENGLCFWCRRQRWVGVKKGEAKK